MKVSSQSPYWLIILSFSLALVIEVLPLPSGAQIFRPELFYLVLIYWSIYSPLRLGLGFAFLSGLVLDVLQGNALGIHSFIMISLIVFMYVFCRRVRMFDIWKQCVLIFFILCASNFVYSILQLKVPSFDMFIIPAGVSAMFWPGLVILLSYVDRAPNNFYRL